MEDAVTQIGSKIKRRKTRSVRVGDIIIGSEGPIAVQSMCATHTQDVPETVSQITQLVNYGADVIRVAVDSKKDVEALAEIRKKLRDNKVNARIVVDLQESYRLAPLVAPYVEKIRYNPGHLHHHEKETPVHEKVKVIVQAARDHNLAVRIGVNFGSLDPNAKEVHEDSLEAAINSAAQHIRYMEDLSFENFVVSLKSSDPNDVMDINFRFAEQFPDIPIHLGVTEAGLLPMGEIKTRVAFENLLAKGIGDTVRVSLTLPNDKKWQEIEVGKRVIADVYAGRFRSVPRFEQEGLNIISCPSCSRVENSRFVELAEKVKELTQYASKEHLTIAVMGCRVNGPGETDDADIGLWCAPKHVNFKLKGQLIGAFGYDEILGKVKEELDALIASK